MRLAILPWATASIGERPTDWWSTHLPNWVTRPNAAWPYDCKGRHGAEWPLRNSLSGLNHCTPGMLQRWLQSLQAGNAV